jgi:cell division protein FtsL
MMTDWSVGVEIRNYRITRRTDPRHLADLLVSMLCVLMIAGALVGHLWIRNRILNMGYAIQQMKETDAELTRIQNSLILEEETLKCPERIDFIARNELAMEPLGPYQRITLRFHETGSDRPTSLALADTGTASAQQPRRPSAIIY